MRIENTNVGGHKPEDTQHKAASQASRPERTVDDGRDRTGEARAAGIGSDQVNLSGLSQKLLELTVESPERERRIAELGAAYTSGNLQVDASQLSQRLIDDSLANSDSRVK